MIFKTLSPFSKLQGTIKEDSDHFKVNEIPLYDLSGQGEHYYHLLEKKNLTTDEIIKSLSQDLGIKVQDIGYAGKKDKFAHTTQYISLPLKVDKEYENANIKFVSQHKNKLKMGHLKGNKFEIIVCSKNNNQLDELQKTQEHLLEYGCPNYFGPQRFSKNNHLYGQKILMGEKKVSQKGKRMFFLSAFQSYLFNLWLEKRIQNDQFYRNLLGDFLLHDGKVFTGPLFGTQMKEAKEKAYEMEKEIYEQFNLSPEILKKAHLKGNRRPGKIFINDFKIEEVAAGYKFSFSLPKGSYATTVISEFFDLGWS